MTSRTRDTTRGPDARVRRGLAERKQQVTREAIMEAVGQALREVGIDFSMQDVADRAGVTSRTVYRYFESREALLDAVGRWQDEWLETAGAPEPQRLDELPAAIERLFIATEHRPDFARAHALMALTRNEQSRSRRERTGRQRRLARAACPHLPEDEFAGDFAVVRALAGSIGWFVLTSQFGLSSREAGAAARRALEALIADVRRRDQEAAAEM